MVDTSIFHGVKLNQYTEPFGAPHGTCPSLAGHEPQSYQHFCGLTPTSYSVLASPRKDRKVTYQPKFEIFIKDFKKIYSFVVNNFLDPFVACCLLAVVAGKKKKTQKFPEADSHYIAVAAHVELTTNSSHYSL